MRGNELIRKSDSDVVKFPEMGTCCANSVDSAVQTV